jgi:hypothetical protein
MAGFYIILGGLVLVALFGFIISYIEDHSEKTLNPKDHY